MPTGALALIDVLTLRNLVIRNKTDQSLWGLPDCARRTNAMTRSCRWQTTTKRVVTHADQVIESAAAHD